MQKPWSAGAEGSLNCQTMSPPNSLVGPDPGKDGGAPGARLAGILRYPFVILTVLWFFGVILVDVFEKDLWELFFALLVPWGFVGGGIIFALTIARLHMRLSAGRIEALTAIGIIMAGLITHFGAGRYLSMDVRFLIAKPYYERRLADVLSGGFADQHVGVASREPGGRVAFYWKKGFGPDNWVGLVYDPTGEVMRAVNFLLNPSATFDPVQDKVRDLFGGELYATRHLTGDWFICWFT